MGIYHISIKRWICNNSISGGAMESFPVSFDSQFNRDLEISQEDKENEMDNSEDSSFKTFGGTDETSHDRP